MRFPFSGKTAIRTAALVALAAGSVVLVNGARKTPFSKHELAAYADPNLVQYVQPGLSISVVSANVATDGTVTVDYKLTDPNGAGLDRSGIVTPGAVSTSFLIAYVPKGQSQFTSYISKTVTAAVGGATAVQATGDSGGTYTVVSTGEYIYKFNAKLPSGFDSSASHRIGIYGSRNLTQWSLGTNYADTTFDFVPAGGQPSPRDVVRTADCNKCHGSLATTTGANGLAAHGGSRRSVGLCIMCHTPQTTDPDTGNTVDFKVFIHKLHAGSVLPSVQAGTPYQIIGFGNAVNDWSTVNFPADVRRCEVCHNPKNGAAQTTAWISNPNRAACGSCHDNVNFASGLNHVNLPQVNDKQCTQCHIPQGELEFDASIRGAHTIPDQSTQIGGINFAILKVTGGTPGTAPTVTFTTKDNNGTPIPMSKFTSGGSLSLSMSGPTTDFGTTNFGSDTTNTPGYVTESIAAGANCGGDGTCTYTFKHAVPAGSTGTFIIGGEARLSATLNPGTTTAQTVQYAAKNPVTYFSVDGSKVAARRQVVATANCNNCHSYLEVHGGLRNQVEYCVICHNPSNTDFTTRSAATVAADKAQPNQAINFALMVHKIHTGENMTEFGQTYTIVGHGGSHNDFSDVRYPAMGPTGSTGDTAQCYMCHANNSETVFPIGKNPVTDPQGLMNPAPATTSACTACHMKMSATAHAAANTDPKYGESCDVCHASGAEFDVQKMHAGK